LKPETALRHAIVWQWLLALASVLLFRLEASGLPPLLSEFAVAEAAEAATARDFWVGGFAGVWIAASFAASVGVFLLAHWARTPYLVLAGLGCVLIGLLEPSVTSPLSAVAETAAQLVVGLVLGLVFFSPLSDAFAPHAPRGA
jgi:hypothetical protein